AGVARGVLRRGHQPVVAGVQGVSAQPPAEAQLVRADPVLMAEAPAQPDIAGAAVSLGLPLARFDAALAPLDATGGPLDGALRHDRLRDPVLHGGTHLLRRTWPRLGGRKRDGTEAQPTQLGRLGVLRDDLLRAPRDRAPVA